MLHGTNDQRLTEGWEDQNAVELENNHNKNPPKSQQKRRSKTIGSFVCLSFLRVCVDKQANCQFSLLFLHLFLIYLYFHKILYINKFMFDRYKLERALSRFPPAFIDPLDIQPQLGDCSVCVDEEVLIKVKCCKQLIGFRCLRTMLLKVN